MNDRPPMMANPADAAGQLLEGGSPTHKDHVGTPAIAQLKQSNIPAHCTKQSRHDRANQSADRHRRSVEVAYAPAASNRT